MTRPLGHRGLVVALALCAAGSTLILLAAGRPWAVGTQRAAPGLPETQMVTTGTAAAPGLSALGLAGLAAMAALLATHGRARQLVGTVVVLLAAAALAGTWAGAPGAGRTAWPLVAAGGAGLLLAGGVLASARGRRWPGMSTRYERQPAARARSADPWVAIDRGEDPTL